MAKTIVISSFDPFGKNAENNSRIIADLVEENFSNAPDIKIVHCKLNTIYQKSFEQLKDCVASLDEAPDFIVSLGQGECKSIKLERYGYNKNHSYMEDNDGVIRNKEVIDPSAPKSLDSRIDWKAFYKTLSFLEKRNVKLSYNPGRFVCNDLLFRSLQSFEDIPLGFVHVPDITCKSLEKSQKRSAKYLGKLINYLGKI